MKIKFNLFSFVLGIVLTVSLGVGAVILYNAKDIEFTPKDTTWNVTNMEEAINDIKENYTPNSDVNDILEKLSSWTYSYTGAYQVFNVPITGTYKIELWGAQGGTITYASDIYKLGGNGAYTSGKIYLNKNEQLYVYVGQQGVLNDLKASYNGGGGGASTDSRCASGGGATDVRLVNGNWDNFDSLKSRIMVAAGGAGAERDYPASYGGSLNILGTNTTTVKTTQTSGYKFGIGQNATVGVNASGAGGGYYGGVTGYAYLGSVGGSSFISGHAGCNAISNSSTSTNIVHTGQANHYSGKAFTDTVMKSGNESQPSKDGNTTMIGNTGNGYARITLVSMD